MLFDPGRMMNNLYITQKIKVYQIRIKYRGQEMQRKTFFLFVYVGYYCFKALPWLKLKLYNVSTESIINHIIHAILLKCLNFTEYIESYHFEMFKFNKGMFNFQI